MRLVWATVVELEDPAGSAAQRVAVEVDGGASARAVAYASLVGPCAVGDRVLLNATAVDLELGTGGLHFVVARMGSGAGIALDSPSGGHIMKLRYTPLQLDVVSVESPESPHHAVMAEATSLEGVPVVCCGLHSQVPLVAAAVKSSDPSLRVAYCMTDHAALPIALSGIVEASVAAGLVDATITCGQAFGGQYEAVNLFSGLLAAKWVARADVVVVGIGPGVVGTATPFGHGGIAQGEAINAVGTLGGTPVTCLRLSFADPRERHRGVSHHTLAALSQVALVPSLVAVPSLPAEKLHAILADLDTRGVWHLHRREDSAVSQGVEPDMRGVRVTTMGRGPQDDPAFFAAAFAAGDIAFRVGRGVLKPPIPMQ